MRAVRRIIGDRVALMVDYNPSLTPVEACRRVARLAEWDVHWVEEPVRSEDFHEHAKVRVMSPVRVQMRENSWFPRDMASAFAAEATDLVMRDVMKIGEVTG